MAIICVVTLVAGFLWLRSAGPEGSTALGIGAPVGADASVSAPAGDASPAGAISLPAGAISLPELVQEIRATTTTSTTLARTTPTTKRKPVTPTTTARPVATTTRPAPAAPPTTVAPTPLTPLTTLLEKVVPPAVAVAGSITRTDSGVASWFGAPAGTCAHRSLPMATVVKVTRIANGASATCKVDDRGPTAGTGRLIDLSLDTFQKLAPKDTGLIDVRIEW